MIKDIVDGVIKGGILGFIFAVAFGSPIGCTVTVDGVPHHVEVHPR